MGLPACAEANCAKHISEHLKSYESMTWASILAASGGKRSGTNNHPVEISKLSKSAKDRLNEIEMKRHDSIFSLRLEGDREIIRDYVG
jgi:hypothetical protein